MITLHEPSGQVTLHREPPATVALKKGEQAVVVSGGSSNPVLMTPRRVVLSLTNLARSGPPGRDGRDGNALVPEILDGGNF